MFLVRILKRCYTRGSSGGFVASAYDVCCVSQSKVDCWSLSHLFSLLRYVTNGIALASMFHSSELFFPICVLVE